MVDHRGKMLPAMEDEQEVGLMKLPERKLQKVSDLEGNAKNKLSQFKINNI